MAEVDKNYGSGIIKTKNVETAVSGVNFVGKIDKSFYKEISKTIITDEVIITDERIEHIIQRRGQEFYDKYRPYFAEIVENPDYIFKDKKINTALAAKSVNKDGSSVNIVIKIATETDDPEFKNSIITAVVEGRKRFEQRLRNNEPIYKRVDNNK